MEREAAMLIGAGSAICGAAAVMAAEPVVRGRAAQVTVAVSTVVVFGTLDSVVPPEMGRHYKEILPNCNLVFLYDAAHEADADRPEAFVTLVNDFLERHGAFVIKTESDLINR